jgi:hypothetical protein
MVLHLVGGKGERAKLQRKYLVQETNKKVGTMLWKPNKRKIKNKSNR